MKVSHRTVYVFETARGNFIIGRLSDRRWHVTYAGESLGSYETPQLAAEELALSVTYWPGFDPTALGIPDDLGDWNAVTV